MFLADQHTHSICSPDGAYPMWEMAEGAVRAGVNALCITDHCDFLSLEGAPVRTYDWAPSLAQLSEAKARFGTQLELTLGLEFGMSHLDTAAAQCVLEQPALDFVIGAVHNQSLAAGGRDFYCLDYAREEDCYAALGDYFQSLQSLAEAGCYDVLAHIPYPLRYMKGQYTQPISLRPYREQMREIFRTVLASGRGIEVNTWKGQTLSEWRPILQDYRDCGGEIITVGSDAHAPDPIGRGIAEAYALLRELGFRYVASYHGRVPNMIKL